MKKFAVAIVVLCAVLLAFGCLFTGLPVQAQEERTRDKVDREKAAALKSRQKEKNW